MEQQQQSPPAAGPQPIAEMRILLFRGGQVSVMGPIGDKIAAYGILMRAIDAVRDYDPAKERAKLVLPAPGFDPQRTREGEA